MVRPAARASARMFSPERCESPQSRGHTFAAQPLGGLAGVRFDAVKGNAGDSPSIGDFLDGIKAGTCRCLDVQQKNRVCVMKACDAIAVKAMRFFLPFADERKAQIVRIPTTAEPRIPVARALSPFPVAKCSSLAMWCIYCHWEH